MFLKIYNIYILLNSLFLISFPVVVDREEAFFSAVGLVILGLLAYFFGAAFLIYLPIRLIHWLITKKPIASWELFFFGLTLVFVLFFAIFYNIMT
tara:strand:- start:244 stop:528 length:285 start_codon:yes stop_codon:yes gene_type:complete